MRIVTSFIVLLALVGCTQFGNVSPSDMTPEEVAVWANRTYEQQYAAYLQDYERGKDNTAMQEVLRKKRALMVDIYPVLLTYNSILSIGDFPDEDLTNELISLIYKLTGVY